jgi:hypothetical protein
MGKILTLGYCANQKTEFKEPGKNKIYKFKKIIL